MKSELKNCPFCGCEAKSFHNTNSDYEKSWYWTVVCTKCNIEMHSEDSADDSSPIASIKAWNNRCQQKEIDKLEADLKEANFKLYLIQQGLTTAYLDAAEKKDE